MSLMSSILPLACKLSFVIPLSEKGDGSHIEAYRGICLVSAIPKMLNFLVSKHLVWHTNKIIINEEHGFCREKSTSTNSILLIKNILEDYQSGTQFDVVYTDFSKASDLVNQNLLLTKLDAISIGGALILWFDTFHRGRSQMVRYRRYLSGTVEVTSGVPQGSHLGPELFKLFINDCLMAKILLFEDDSKFFLKIRDESDGLSLQRQINKFVEWTRSNFLLLNVNKCQIIYFSRSRDLIVHHYVVEGFALNRVECV